MVPGRGFEVGFCFTRNWILRGPWAVMARADRSLQLPKVRALCLCNSVGKIGCWRFNYKSAGCCFGSTKRGIKSLRRSRTPSNHFRSRCRRSSSVTPAGQGENLDYAARQGEARPVLARVHQCMEGNDIGLPAQAPLAKASAVRNITGRRLFATLRMLSYCRKATRQSGKSGRLA